MSRNFKHLTYQVSSHINRLCGRAGWALLYGYEGLVSLRENLVPTRMNNLDVVCRLKARPRESVYVNLNWIATNSSIRSVSNLVTNCKIKVSRTLNLFRAFLIAGGRLESEAGS